MTAGIGSNQGANEVQFGRYRLTLESSQQIEPFQRDHNWVLYIKTIPAPNEGRVPVGHPIIDRFSQTNSQELVIPLDCPTKYRNPQGVPSYAFCAQPTFPYQFYGFQKIEGKNLRGRMTFWVDPAKEEHVAMAKECIERHAAAASKWRSRLQATIRNNFK
jgi:hypothetical protein